MSDIPGNEPLNNENESIESTSKRYNLDSLEDYLSVSERVAHEGRLDEAVDMLREANKRYPDSPTGRYNLGVALFLRVKQDREHLELWENLADDEQYAEEAIVALEGAIEADPGYIPAYNNLGRLYALRGRKPDAIAVWQKSLQLKPDQPEVVADMEMYRDDLSLTDEEIETQKLMNGEKPDAPL
jgi:tetratricopeptide (TPR) repeat protein